MCYTIHLYNGCKHCSNNTVSFTYLPFPSTFSQFLTFIHIHMTLVVAYAKNGGNPRPYQCLRKHANAQPVSVRTKRLTFVGGKAVLTKGLWDHFGGHFTSSHCCVCVCNNNCSMFSIFIVVVRVVYEVRCVNWSCNGWVKLLPHLQREDCRHVENRQVRHTRVHVWRGWWRLWNSLT